MSVANRRHIYYFPLLCIISLLFSACMHMPLETPGPVEDPTTDLVNAIDLMVDDYLNIMGSRVEENRRLLGGGSYLYVDTLKAQTVVGDNIDPATCLSLRTILPLFNNRLVRALSASLLITGLFGSYIHCQSRINCSLPPP